MSALVDPGKVCLFIPGNLKKFKLHLFERIGKKIQDHGGQVIKSDASKLDELPADIIPIVGCQPESTALIAKWRATGRKWAYWDRGYAERVFATWTPRGTDGGYYRWHIGSFQMQAIRHVPGDRWANLKTAEIVRPWNKNGRHIVIAEPSPTYERFHRIEGWTKRTVAEVQKYTNRPLVFRDKESKINLLDDCRDAHCLVTHGSIAAVESVFFGCPVFVHPDSAARLVGLTDISKIEAPVYPDRRPWLNSLAYNQFNEKELVDGTLWRLID